MRLTRTALAQLISFATSLDEARSAGEVEIEGDPDLLERLLASLEKPGVFFNVVEP